MGTLRCSPSAHCDENIDPERDRYVGSHPVDLHGQVAGRTVGRPGVQVAAEVERPQEVLDVERAVNYLRDVGSLWAESPRGVRREFVREVFSRIVVRGSQVESITPKATYEALFVLDRCERFNGEMGVIWLPGQDSNLQPSG